MPDLYDFADQLHLTAAECRAAADGGLVRQLEAGINRAVEPIAREIRDGLGGYMPTRYAGVLSRDLLIGSSEKVAGTTVTVQLRARTMRKQRKLSRLNQGMLSHPLFGDRQHWYSQTARVTAGFFTRPIQQSRTRLHTEISGALERVAEQIAGA